MSNTEKGTMIGYGADMKQIRVGDRVDHAVKGFRNGVVREGGLTYKGEVACRVDFPENPAWVARVSKLRAAKPLPKTVKDFGYEVGEQVDHIKYTELNPLTITSKEVGEYRGEPCCYTGGGRPTRFSQIVKHVEIAEPAFCVDEEFEVELSCGQILNIHVYTSPLD